MRSRLPEGTNVNNWITGAWERLAQGIGYLTTCPKCHGAPKYRTVRQMKNSACCVACIGKSRKTEFCKKGHKKGMRWQFDRMKSYCAKCNYQITKRKKEGDK